MTIRVHSVVLAALALAILFLGIFIANTEDADRDL